MSNPSVFCEEKGLSFEVLGFGKLFGKRMQYLIRGMVFTSAPGSILTVIDLVSLR